MQRTQINFALKEAVTLNLKIFKVDFLVEL